MAHKALKLVSGILAGAALFYGAQAMYWGDLDVGNWHRVGVVREAEASQTERNARAYEERLKALETSVLKKAEMTDNQPGLSWVDQAALVREFCPDRVLKQRESCALEARPHAPNCNLNLRVNSGPWSYSDYPVSVEQAEKYVNGK